MHVDGAEQAATDTLESPAVAAVDRGRGVQVQAEGRGPAIALREGDKVLGEGPVTVERLLEIDEDRDLGGGELAVDERQHRPERRGHLSMSIVAAAGKCDQLGLRRRVRREGQEIDLGAEEVALDGPLPR